MFKGNDMKLVPKRKWLLAVGLLLLFIIVIQVGRQFFREQEWQVRHSIYTRIKKAYPQAAKRLEQAHEIGRASCRERVSSPV